jgi:hypothetical protein
MVVMDKSGRPVHQHAIADEMRKVKSEMQHPDALNYVMDGLRKNATIELYQSECDEEMVKAVTGRSGV